MNRIEAAYEALAAHVEPPEAVDHCCAELALEAADAPVKELIKLAESRHGRLYCHVTTYELRLALGMDVTDWPNVPEEPS